MNQKNWISISSAMIMATISINTEIKETNDLDSNKINTQTTLSDFFDFDKDSSPCSIGKN